MNKSLICSLATVATLTLSGLSIQSSHATPFTDADKAVDYRQQSLQLVRENFAFMASMVRGERDYDAELFEERAKALSHLSHVPWDGFKHAGYQHRGSGDALPGVWEEWDDFESRYQQFQEDAAALVEAAASHEMSNIRDAFMSTARNCQQCHDLYRD